MTSKHMELLRMSGSLDVLISKKSTVEAISECLDHCRPLDRVENVREYSFATIHPREHQVQISSLFRADEHWWGSGAFML